MSNQAQDTITSDLPDLSGRPLGEPAGIGDAEAARIMRRIVRADGTGAGAYKFNSSI
jgi:hypothetical protein